MFLGISDAGGTAASYADAVKVLQRAALTPTGRKRLEKPEGYPLGGHSKSVTWVRKDDDGAIAFTLYHTDVVLWHPDNSFEIDNYGTVTTSGFAHRFLPAGMHLHRPTYRRGCEGGHRGIGYRDGGQHICFGDIVRFVPRGDSWAPDEATCDEVLLPVGVDRRAARALSKCYNLRDFELWLSMAPMHLAGTESAVEHAEWDLDQCLNALVRRDFRQAAAHLPLISEPEGFGTAKLMKPLAIATRRGDSHITMASLSKLKLALWSRERAIIVEGRKTWAQREFLRGMTRLRELRSLNADLCTWGP